MLTWFRKKMKTIMIVVAVLFVGSMFYGLGLSRFGGEEGRQPTQGIAKINGQALDPLRYQEMLNRLIRQFEGEARPSDLAYLQNLALGQTVDFLVILEQAKKQVRVSNQEVEAAISGMMQQQGLQSRRELEEGLRRMGMDLRRFRQLIKDEILVQKMVTKVRGEVTVTPDDLKEVRASHVLVSAESKAREIYERAKKGEDFAALARLFSLDPGSARKGGDLGFFATGAMVEPFEQAAFSLKPGEISPPVKSPFGYHVIKVTDSRLRRFTGEQKDIDQAALADKQEKIFTRWYGQLRQRTRLEIVNPMLQAHDYRFKGQIYEAIKAYQKAISENPGNPYLRVFLGDTYNTIGKSDLALAEYEAAVAIEGGNPIYYLLLAATYEKLGQTQNAVKEYKRASLVAADDKEMHRQLLKKFQELKAYDQVSREKAEINRIEKKERFEKELTGEQ